MILIYVESGNVGEIKTPSGRVGGEHAHPRHYRHTGHYLEIEGEAHIVTHDVDEICKIPGYRLASPSELDAYMASKNKKTSIREGSK
jgi:hypothetical protein